MQLVQALFVMIAGAIVTAIATDNVAAVSFFVHYINLLILLNSLNIEILLAIVCYVL